MKRGISASGNSLSRKMKSHHYSRDKPFSSSKRAILGSAAGEKSLLKLKVPKLCCFELVVHMSKLAGGVDRGSSTDARGSRFEPRLSEIAASLHLRQVVGPRS